MGTKAITTAVENNDLGMLEKELDFFKTITGKNYDLNQIVRRGGKKLLHIAAQNNSHEALLYLLNKGANININDDKKNTAAHIATLNCHPKTLSLLIEKGVNLSLTNKDGFIAKECIPFKKIKLEISTQLESIFQKKEKNKLEILTQVATSILKPLTQTTQSNQEQLKPKEIYGVNFKVGALDLSFPKTLKEAVLKKDLSSAKRLLKNKADPNKQDSEGRTPLHHAAINACEPMIKLLLNKGAYRYIRDNLGRIPLSYMDKSNGCNVPHPLTENNRFYLFSRPYSTSSPVPIEIEVDPVYVFGVTKITV